MTTRVRSVLLPVLVPVAAALIWWFASQNSQSPYFPPLPDILTSFQQLWLFDRWPSDVLPSLRRMAAGYGISAVAGVAAGVAIALVPIVRRAIDPYIEFLRAIPPAAMIPFGILVLGIDDGMKIAVIVLGTIWPILLNTVDGVRGVNETLLETAQVHGVSRTRRLLSVTLPAASPQIFAGLRTSLALALILMVISEMVASTNGLGYFILQAQRTFAISDMWSGIVLLSLLGFVINGVFSLVERRMLRWYRGAQAIEE